MATIDIEKVTQGKGTYQIVGYDTSPAAVASGIKLRFEMVPFDTGGRLIDLTLSESELTLVAAWIKDKKGA